MRWTIPGCAPAAMSGTPITSKAAGVPYTVVGGGRRDKIRKYPFKMTVLILTRGGRLFRGELLEQIASLGIGEVVWVEGPEASRDLESLCRDFPEARFLTMQTETSIGAMIDIGISESQAPHVLCMWSDMRIAEVSPAAVDFIGKYEAVCLLPVIKNRDRSIVPSYQAPYMKKGKLSLHFRPPSREGEKVLYPFDFCGIYDRERFARAGGFDAGIENPYWQKLDFGFRCHLWGEKILGTRTYTLFAGDSVSAEDATPDESYKAFYLKNLAVRFRREMGALPRIKVLEYVVGAGTSPVSAIREFREARDWVFLNRFRFRRDPRELIEKWGDT